MELSKQLNLPEQAVILCGGLGTRLRPLTETMPKPMVSVNGIPFIEHLIAQIRGQGIKRVLLLTGYRGEMIQSYLGSGTKFDLQIGYSHGPVEWDTGRRLWEARGKIEPRFLLLYSDNFVQFNFQRLGKLHTRLRTPISLLLAPKEKGNIRVSEDGRIEAYDKSRNGDGFKFVEVGYMLVERDSVFEHFSACLGFPDISFSQMLEKFAQESKIAGLIVRDPYYSISDVDRLELMSKYLKPKKILLIDRDGTINKKAPQGEYITCWDNFQWIPETLAAMKILASEGFEFIVITNQAGIAREMVSKEQVDNIHKNMIDELQAQGVSVIKVYMSPDHWDGDSFTRKPAPGMFFQAAKDYNLRMDHSIYIGDDERDCVAAANAGCGMIYLSESDEDPILEEYPSPYFKSRSLLECVDSIKHVYRSWDVSS